METAKEQSFIKGLMALFVSAQFGRFVLVGLSNTFVGYGFFWLGLWLLESRFPEQSWVRITAFLFSYALATLWAYILHGKVTFKVTLRDKMRRTSVRFAITQAGMALLGSGLLELGVRLSGYDPRLVWFGVAVVTTITNFLVTKFWVFR